MSKFGFGSKQSETEKQLETARDLQEEALEQARLLLHSEPCKELLEKYKLAERETIDVLIKYAKDELDAQKFGNGVRVLLLQLVNLRAFITTLTAKAGEKYTDV